MADRRLTSLQRPDATQPYPTEPDVHTPSGHVGSHRNVVYRNPVEPDSSRVATNTPQGSGAPRTDFGDIKIVLLSCGDIFEHRQSLNFRADITASYCHLHVLGYVSTYLTFLTHNSISVLPDVQGFNINDIIRTS
jgi:hypothetical protein